MFIIIVHGIPRSLFCSTISSFVEKETVKQNKVGHIMCPNLKNDFVKLKECYPTLTVNSPAFKFDILFKNREFANINNVIRKQIVTF